MKAIGDFFDRVNIPLLVVGALLAATYVGWVSYATAEWGVDRGVGVLVAWPALLLGAALVLAPFVAVGWLVTRLVRERGEGETEVKGADKDEDEAVEDSKQTEKDEAEEKETAEAEADEDEDADDEKDDEEDDEDDEEAEEEEDEGEDEEKDEEDEDASDDEETTADAATVEKPPLPDSVSEESPSLFERAAAAVVVRFRRITNRNDES